MLALSRRSLAIAFTTAVCLASPTFSGDVFAQQPAETGQPDKAQINLARQAASEGLQAYRNSEFEKALNLFEQAKALYPSAQIVRMIGYSLLALERWMPAAEANRPVSPADQRRKGRSGRPLPGGGEAVVLRRDGEILIALVVNGRVRESWRVTSETPLAEVQLAEPVAHRLVLVVRTYTDTTDEFVVLVLDRKGIVTRFATPTDEWAEAAAGRFRLSGDRLYRLGSTARGAFIDRYDLGGAR